MKKLNIEKKQSLKLNGVTFPLSEYVENSLNVYTCGPTTYYHTHIGNLRAPIILDVLLNALKFKKFKINNIHNLTDIDDKIIEAAKEKGISPISHSDYFIKKYMEIFSLLNLNKPTQMPKVSENIKGIVDFIKILVDEEKAYVKNGEVFFDIKKVGEEYLKGANLKKENLLNIKSKSFDFRLWKNTDDQSYYSPWSMGRPGWHTECAYFIDTFFKSKTIDIHLGGIDLKFPHHENERIQYYAKNGIEIAKVFLHVGKVNLNGKKMSKSLKNFILTKDFIKNNSSNELKYLFYQVRYSKPIDFNDNYFQNFKREYQKLEIFLEEISNIELKTKEVDSEIINEAIEFIFDDLRINKVLILIQELMAEIKKHISKISHEIEVKINTFYKIMKIVGLNI